MKNTKNTKKVRKVLRTFGYFWDIRYSWVFMRTFGYFWMLVSTSFVFMGTFGYSWILLGTFGYLSVVLNNWVYFWGTYNEYKKHKCANPTKSYKCKKKTLKEIPKNKKNIISKT